jgi:hypothetical protein
MFFLCFSVFVNKLVIDQDLSSLALYQELVSSFLSFFLSFFIFVASFKYKKVVFDCELLLLLLESSN